MVPVGQHDDKLSVELSFPVRGPSLDRVFGRMDDQRAGKSILQLIVAVGVVEEGAELVADVSTSIPGQAPERKPTCLRCV